MGVEKDLANKNIIQRQSLTVYLNSISDQYKLRRYGDIVYFSKKFAYCILYVNKKDIEQVCQDLNSLDFVEKVEKSNRNQIDLSSDHIEKQITELAQEAEKTLQERQEDTEQLL
ncbi:YlbG family protein [Lactobacillus kullabergensis]|nr:MULTISPECIES: YlbG family protein [unclassified Lactobacillus]MBI0120386.1 YlbG family protein [Lactobacillus sp. M0398]MBI0122534.1 YlbG family protein [Lactobacillus sp. W8174]MBI0134402.1 YlbG family protein [Lactobacillus sp. W8173]MCX0290596.1 YlbG family protein [Lactobacillus kullabergensis]